jgi:hypothetical protein
LPRYRQQCRAAARIRGRPAKAQILRADGGWRFINRQAPSDPCGLPHPGTFLAVIIFLSGNLIAWDGERQRNVTEISSFFVSATANSHG